jgi:glycosyltransferase involved in cell wall biosynthesis
MDAGEESLKALEVQLQILVITYNRAAFLQKTFEQFEASPFAGCAITVLDNCSSDDTPRVCERFRSRFRSLEIIRHPKNIGASANYLRAVETAKATYTWIVCDDDRLDLHAAQDVVLKLREGKVDLVHLGLLGNYGWTRGAESKSNELALAASHYFFVLSFLPDLIFRTELFNSQHLTAGYRNIFNLYPHFPFLAETAARAYSIYVSSERIVYRGEEQNYLSGFTVVQALGQ